MSASGRIVLQNSADLECLASVASFLPLFGRFLVSAAPAYLVALTPGKRFRKVAGRGREAWRAVSGSVRLR